MIDKGIKEWVERYIEEDVGAGDVTTLATIPNNIHGEAKLWVKEQGILAGVAIAKQIFEWYDTESKVEIFLHDGTICDGNKNLVFSVKSNVHTLLKLERLILNIMQRMSGIATTTHKFVKAVEGTKAIILDTRKTTPGFRYFEKMAVRIGGGQNHRFGLFDQILIKDNHIDFAGGIDNALIQTQKYIEKNNLQIPIEVEARTLSDIEKILQYPFVTIILLDNFSLSETQQAVKLIDGKVKVESSGGINIHNVRDYALCGVDYISIGALTHHVSSLDLSLKASF
ncbi:MAG: carboxylating nicotinate-nucleotide diphosphorylase [Bacteroidales bacterium]|nr:carboxylating nicotinate-nucleotide diphosphorylase [Bacteroidales bacterium]